MTTVTIILLPHVNKAKHTTTSALKTISTHPTSSSESCRFLYFDDQKLGILTTAFSRSSGLPNLSELYLLLFQRFYWNRPLVFEVALTTGRMSDALWKQHFSLTFPPRTTVNGVHMSSMLISSPVNRRLRRTKILITSSIIQTVMNYYDISTV